MSECMTHPDILNIERYGYPEPRPDNSDRPCIICGHGISPVNEEHYNTPNGLVCSECGIEYMDSYWKVAG